MNISRKSRTEKLEMSWSDRMIVSRSLFKEVQDFASLKILKRRKALKAESAPFPPPCPFKMLVRVTSKMLIVTKRLVKSYMVTYECVEYVIGVHDIGFRAHSPNFHNHFEEEKCEKPYVYKF